VIFPSNLCSITLNVNLVIMQVVWDKNRICRGEKSTCLSQHKATLMIFRSCSLETSELPINSSIFYSKQTSGTNMQSTQTRTNKTIHQSRKGFKERTRVGSRAANAKTLGAIGRFRSYHTRLCAWYI
jgi:hypothetical protein